MKVICLVMLAILLSGCGGNPYQDSIDKAEKIRQETRQIMDDLKRDLEIQRLLNDYP